MAGRSVLTKCRLCLKLGDFYSIFAADNRVQLASMAMACSSVQIYEGDGLPDKVCGECVEKLSAAYIFKKQCERSDIELRKVLKETGVADTTIEPIEINNTTPRQKPGLRKSLRETAKRQYREIDESDDSTHHSQHTHSDLLEERYSVQVADTISFEGANSGLTIKKRRLSETSQNSSFGTPGMMNKDSTECKICNKTFSSYRSNNSHQRVHKEGYIPAGGLKIHTIKSEGFMHESPCGQETFTCDKCGKEYHSKIIYKEHVAQCDGEEKLIQQYERLICQLTCPICKRNYKKTMYLRKHLGQGECALPFKQHMQQVSGRRIGNPDGSFTMEDISKEIDRILAKVRKVQCSNCGMRFRFYASMLKHFFKCTETSEKTIIRCLTCNIGFDNRKLFVKHVKTVHIDVDSNNAPVGSANTIVKSEPNALQCSKCDKTFENQTKLVMHLAMHMPGEDNSAVTIKGSVLPFKCMKCDRTFRYRASLRNHIKIHSRVVKVEEDPDELAYKCEICFRGFINLRALYMHKKMKHMTIEDPIDEPPKRGIEYAKCPAKCLHCNIILDNYRAIKLHNKTHIENNIKVKNEYTCPVCSLKFTNTKIFRIHIREHNYEGGESNDETIFDASISNFCEVTSELNKDTDDEFDVKPTLNNKGEVITSDLVSTMACNLCDEKLASLKEYHEHMQTHADNNPDSLSCFVCHAIFDQESDYRKHMKIHYYDKNINPNLLVCKLCNRPSKNMRSYIAHMSWHSAVGSFKCLLCNETFAYNKYYDSHMRATHSININEVSEYSKHRCNMCKKFYDSERSLEYHMKCHEKGDELPSDNKCHVCEIEFSTKYKLAMHVQTYHNVSVEENSHFSSPIRKYEALKIKPVDFSCPVCEASFPTQSSADRHLRRHHPVEDMVKKDDPDGEPDVHACPLCGKEFPTAFQLKFHVGAHKRKSTIYSCSLCTKKSFSMKMHEMHLLREHLLQNNPEPIPCDNCEEKFGRRQDLRVHLQTAHDITEDYVLIEDSTANIKTMKPEELHELQCPICSKVMMTEKAYERHLSWHYTRKCNYCGNCFEKKEVLTEHKTVCEKRKLLGDFDPYDKKLKCFMCHKTFNIAVKLNCHLKVKHNADSIPNNVRERAATCDFCFSVFDSEERMLSHRRCHFSGGNMYCTICSKCIRPLYFKKHRYAHYSETFDETPFQCEHCTETFVKVRAFVSHLKNVHDQPMNWYVHRESPTEKCHICHKDFVNLSRHLQHHEKYRCKKCFEYFFSEVVYNEHLCQIPSDDEAPRTRRSRAVAAPIVESPVEEEEFNEDCEFCFKSFSNQYAKTKHEYNHSNLIFYGCRLCGKSFSMRGAFTMHTVSHRLQHFNKNPLVCRHCDETFIRLNRYLDHMAQAHNETETLEHQPKCPLEKCQICHKSFTNIYRHYKYHEALKCADCNKYILSEELFKKHACDDKTEDQNLIVEFDGDINLLMHPDFSEFHIKRLNPIGFENEAEECNNSLDQTEDYNNSCDAEYDEHREAVKKLLPGNLTLSREISIVPASKRKNAITLDPPLKIERFPFSNFSPVISSTVSLYTENGDNNLDDHELPVEIKTEPIDYYEDFPFQRDIEAQMD